MMTKSSGSCYKSDDLNLLGSHKLYHWYSAAIAIAVSFHILHLNQIRIICFGGGSLSSIWEDIQRDRHSSY
jgi:hypothetical protein